MTDTEKRALLKAYYKESEKIFSEWAERGYSHPSPDIPPYPEICRGMTCGAKTRAGTLCKRMDIFANGRCKLHGGLSTGPKTTAGKRRSSENGLLAPQCRTNQSP